MRLNSEHPITTENKQKPKGYTPKKWKDRSKILYEEKEADTLAHS